MKSSSKCLLICLLIGFCATLKCQEAGTAAPGAVATKTVRDDSIPPSTTDATTTTTTITPVVTTKTSRAPPETTTPNATTTVPPETTTPNATTTVPPETTTPNATTTVPPETTTPNATTSTTTTPAPPIQPCHRFDGLSFIGGIVLTLALLAISVVAYIFYKGGNQHNYHTL